MVAIIILGSLHLQPQLETVTRAVSQVRRSREDSDYVKEHETLEYLRKKTAHYFNLFARLSSSLSLARGFLHPTDRTNSFTAVTVIFDG